YQTMMSLRPDDPNVYLILGEYSLKAKQYSTALEHFTKANTLKKSADALEGMALSARELGQWDKARDAAESAVALDKSRYPSRKVLAEAYMRGKHYKEAMGQLEALVGKEPSNKKYWEALATCYENLKLEDKLAQADKKLVRLDRKNADARMRLAKYSLKKNDTETAYGLFKQLASLTPKDPFVFNKLYELAKGKKETASAIAYLKKYLALNPKDAESQRDLGDLLYERKQYDGALEAYRTAIKIDPTLKGFHKRYAEIVIAKGQQNEVIKALKGVIDAGEADFGTYQTLGMIYQKKKWYTNAIEMYQKALTLNPQDTDALVALGDCQAGKGMISEAVISYEQAVMMNPKAVDEYKTLGDLYLRQKKEEQAVKAYRKFLDAGGKDSQVASRVGRDLYDKKQYAEAVKYLSMVSGSEANDFYYLLAYGESLYRSDDYDKAIPILKGLVGRNPKLGTRRELMLMIAHAYEKKKDAPLAIAYYEKYLDTGARDADVAYRRAYLEEKANRITYAQKHYLANTRSYPSDYRNFLELGMMYAKKKETATKAVAMLKKVASLVDTIPSVWLEIARLYGKLGKTGEELAAYKKYVQKDPQNVEANVRLGTILLDRGKISEGLIYLETANTLKPNNLDIMLALAKGYTNSKRTGEAEDILKKAKEIKPGDPAIRRQLVTLYRKTGDTREALSEVKDLLKLSRDNETLLLYARLLYSEGKHKDAADAIEDIRATDPENIEALMLLGKVLRARKKYDEAIETYKEVNYIDGSYAPAILERAEVYYEQSKPQWAQKFYERALRADPKLGRAELGLARIAKLRKDRAAYVMHLTKAYQLDPQDPEIREEYQKSQK
ncbi:MAG: tetratricopeptide repeat protein, partial [Chitinivibrionales bacterium]|nr:tetratricopeptide repeat protein [Chitinivibrionales bacterium]MBD3395114.1 tetratricopeptide repeat protein [Chitinivibrionales bacterium]